MESWRHGARQRGVDVGDGGSSMAGTEGVRMFQQQMAGTTHPSSAPASDLPAIEKMSGNDDPWDDSLLKYLLLLGTLVATVTYSAVLNPPGGMWHMWLGSGHLAGDPIRHLRYLFFYYCNATAFMCSLFVIAFLIILLALHDQGGRTWMSSHAASMRSFREARVVIPISLTGAYAAGTWHWRDGVATGFLLALAAMVVAYVVGTLAATMVADVMGTMVVSGWIEQKDNTNLKRQRKGLMVLAAIVVSTTYLGGLNAPGGILDHDDGEGHTVLTSGRHDRRVKAFFIYNTMAFVLSLLIIMVLINKKLHNVLWSGVTGIPLKFLIIVSLYGQIAAYSVSVRSYRALQGSIGAVLITFLAVSVTIFWKKIKESPVWEWLGGKYKSVSDWLEKRSLTCLGGENPQGSTTGNAEYTSDSPLRITDPPYMEEELVLPLSAGKMATEVAILLVERAYCLGAVMNDSRQTLLQKLQSFRADLDQAEGQMIDGSLAFIPNLFRNVSSDIWQLRSAIEEIEDAIDEIDYRKLEEEVGNHILKFVRRKIINKVTRFDVPWSKLNSLRKALGSFQNNLSAFPVQLQILTPAPSTGHEPYGYPSWRTAEHNQGYPSWISNGGAFGRDMEREQIVHWLTKDTAEDNPVSVYAVVGMAGMGKTTLANMVREDPRVQAYFEHVVWVHVSVGFVGFDTEEMGSFILEAIAGRQLRHRKLLLIFDDVWEDSSADKWEMLLAPLKVGKKGSKILLTTRMQSVVDMAARVVGSQVKYLQIAELNENDNHMLFKSYLPSHVDSEDYDNLLLIGEQIVKKIGGCPLVTSIVASWLGSHMDTGHWNTVLQKGWKHLDAKYIVFVSLRLSYDCLPTELQTCFRYCSLFPKGYKFKKVELAKMWTGSGLIPLNSSKLENIGIQKTKYVDLLSAKDVGEEHFEMLTRKSFFCSMLETENSAGNHQQYYVLHGLMHDLAEHVSKGECARVECGDFHSISITTRHLSVGPCSNLGVVLQHLVDISKFTKLRTLMIKIEFGLDLRTELLLGELLKKSRSLRLLYLDVPSLFCALYSIPSLIHLRYLFLFSCDECHLQKVFELYHLQVFRLKYLTSKGTSCIDTHSMRCLCSLHVPDNMSSMIGNIGKLTLLQELHGFEVVKNHDQQLCELGNLRRLCQLTLRNLQNVLNFKEAVDVKLKEKHYLKLLSLSWNKHLMDSVDQDGRIIDNLEPNKELQLLHIHGYCGVKLPVWIENSSLINLVSLELEYCMKWKCLPSLKELTLLKHLRLENLFQLEYIGTVSGQLFGSNDSENAWLPPALSTLTVRWCPNLKELPHIPCTLELLIIKHVQLAGLPGLLQRYTGRGRSAPAKSQLEFLHIESCAQLTSLNSGLLRQQEQLHSLKTLVLRHCERLHHLPTGGFTELLHLNSLEIVACPILKDLQTEENLLPVSLRNLDVKPCGDIKVSVLMSLKNLTSLRRLILFNCSNIEELPSVEVFSTQNNLNDISIARCKKLLSLGGLGAAASLRLLSILCCNKLSSSYSTKVICSFKLQKLTIDHQALLLVEPLRSLKHTSELHISDDYAMESLSGQWFLQNAASLQSIKIGVANSLRSLPSEMEKLGSLQSLHIERAPVLQSLRHLPASLNKLTIWGCDVRFLKCYERDVGSDWGRIAHIANVDMQAISKGMTYSDDDQSQGLMATTSNPYRKYIVID